MKNILLFPALLLLFLAACEKAQHSPPPIKIRVSRPREMLFQEKISVQGNVETVEHATVCARIAGNLDRLTVAEGDKVKNGDPLFQIDKQNLENEVKIIEQNLTVAKTSRDKVKIELEVCKIQHRKTEIDYQRSEKLIGEKVVSQDQFEKDQLQMQKAKAAIGQALAAVKLQEALVEKVKSNLDIAQKRLSDSLVKSHFDGVVTHKFKEEGEYVRPSDCILRLENPARLEISLLISGKYYHQTIPGKTKVKIFYLEGNHLADSVLSYRAPCMDPTSRTYEIKLPVPSRNGLVSGMLCNVKLILAERHGLGVPEIAVLERRSGRKIVFSTDHGKAREVAVEVGIKDHGYYEILNAAELAGKAIVIQGQTFLNPDSKVEILDKAETGK